MLIFLIMLRSSQRYVMLAISANACIFFFQNPTDMRKGIEGLSALVDENCTEELTNRAYFALSIRRRIG